ncbi:MAG TPA: molybdate ABC transporter substrate-binding protein [Desulfomicrobiaceae bacterium]|nr:molybdate ABC transporter substrate-binding protein [Desulfomicrobiaceae bacterium]
MKTATTIVLLVLSLALGTAAPAAELTLASAAGYRKPMTKLADAFEKTHKVTINRIFGNMAQVTAQAKMSGKVDLVFGDRKFLSRSGIDFLDMKEIAQGKLVIAYARTVSGGTAADPFPASIARICMPDPKRAIYGKVAREYLGKTELEKKVKDRLTVVATIPQTASYLITGEAEAGFLNLTHALNVQKKIGTFFQVDPTLYSPIRLVLGLLTPANDARVNAFLAFLKTPKAKRVLKEYGL